MVDAEKICAQFMPEQVPEDFSSLSIPLIVIASDIFQREALALSTGLCVRQLAASIALPALMRPVVIGERTLIDGGATQSAAVRTIAGQGGCRGGGGRFRRAERGPARHAGPWECLVTTVMVMGYAITSEKLKHTAPELIIRPNVGTFRTLDFMQASAILRAAEPVKAEVRTRLAALLTD